MQNELNLTSWQTIWQRVNLKLNEKRWRWIYNEHRTKNIWVTTVESSLRPDLRFVAIFTSWVAAAAEEGPFILVCTLSSKILLSQTSSYVFSELSIATSFAALWIMDRTSSAWSTNNRKQTQILNLSLSMATKTCRQKPIILTSF